MSYTFRSLIRTIASLVALAGGAARCATPNCEGLQGLQLPDTTISLAKSYAKGDAITTTSKAPVDLCRVAGMIAPSSDSNINFEVWMPSSNWTGRYVQTGNAGFAGSIVYGLLSAVAANGDATAVTDDGSSQPPGQPAGSFALNHPERVKDFGFRAEHLTSVNAKSIINAFYGQAPRYSYFRGCSKGGQAALMEAQRFPDDFDGIMAGAAPSHWTSFASAAMWNAQQVADGSNPGYLPSANLAALAAAASAQCASAKLVPADNFFNDPRRCHFNPQVLLCTGAPDSNCLTQPQIDAVQNVLAGPTTASGRIAPGIEPEFGWDGRLTQAAPTPFVSGTAGFFGIGFWGNFMPTPKGLNGPDSFDINTSPFDAAMQLGSVLNAYDPDLRKFRQRGGKLVQYHGWADPLVSPRFAVNYFKSVVEFNEQHVYPDDALKNTQEFFRLYMAPGLGHCSGGPGLNSFGQFGGSGPAESDMFSALERWVEQGIAPDKVIATGGSAPNAFTRPLCPYPQKAHYVSGDPAKADGFVCADDRQRPRRN